jgi:hypothetical protein
MSFENLGSHSPIHVKVGPPKARDILPAPIRHEPSGGEFPHTGVEERDTGVALHQAADRVVRVIQVVSLPVAQSLCAFLRPQHLLPSTEVEQAGSGSCFSRSCFRCWGLSSGLIVPLCSVAWFVAESLAGPEEEVPPKEFKADPVNVALDMLVQLSFISKPGVRSQKWNPRLSHGLTGSATVALATQYTSRSSSRSPANRKTWY